MTDFRLKFQSSSRHFLHSARRLVPLAGLVLVLCACGVKQVTVKDSFPTPVLNQHPQHIGLVLDDDFRNYTHREKLPTGGDWEVALGAANVALFQQVLAGMFARVSEVASTQANPANPAVDAIIKPEIEEFQFATPDQNQTDFYEAWFKYRVHFYNAQGQQLGEWPLIAYGRSESRFLDKEESLRQAAQVAMRDAATAMVLEFDQHPAVRAFLYGPRAAPEVVNQKTDSDAS